MGMPKKGTREIVVDGRAYRWKLNSPPWDSEGWMYPKPLPNVSLMFIQASDVRPGRVCKVLMSYGDDAPVTPEVVMKVVRHCLEVGWDPDERGPAFCVPRTVYVHEMETKASIVRAVMES